MTDRLLQRRGAGVLLPLFSLPGRYGIGTMGTAAYRFVDDLSSAGQRYWQLLPLCPAGQGNSPYQSPGSFAGDAVYIDPQLLVESGYLQPSDLNLLPCGGDDRVDYPAVRRGRQVLFDRLFDRFVHHIPADFDCFCQSQAGWLEDHALFCALSERYGKRFFLWPSALRQREPSALERATVQMERRVLYHKMLQYFLDHQWRALRAYANARGVYLIGDLPIYVSPCSADVWAAPALFMLSPSGAPSRLAGCPPDAFSPTGQLWGNPVYNWSAHARTEYRWWVARLRHALHWFDALRLDHFRGFAAYYSVPARAKNARDGCWLPGPGLSLFSALQQALGDVPLLAEDLGFLDDTVRALLSDCGFPGMQVLQFDFDSRDGSGGAVCKPNTVIYTGTHDNNTLLGWCTTAPRQDIRRACAAYGVRYPNQLPRQMMLSALRSPANTCILTVQDLLGLGSSARINTPSTVGAHNWSWRMRPGALTPGILAHLYTETCAADRAERSNICRI